MRTTVITMLKRLFLILIPLSFMGCCSVTVIDSYNVSDRTIKVSSEPAFIVDEIIDAGLRGDASENVNLMLFFRGTSSVYTNQSYFLIDGPATIRGLSYGQMVIGPFTAPDRHYSITDINPVAKTYSLTNVAPVAVYEYETEVHGRLWSDSIVSNLPPVEGFAATLYCTKPPELGNVFLLAHNPEYGFNKQSSYVRLFLPLNNVYKKTGKKETVLLWLPLAMAADVITSPLQIVAFVLLSLTFRTSQDTFPRIVTCLTSTICLLLLFSESLLFQHFIASAALKLSCGCQSRRPIPRPVPL